jgi:glycerol-3-phosphate dehydrogenase (NAD(P)+)
MKSTIFIQINLFCSGLIFLGFKAFIILSKNLRATLDLAGEIADADYIFIVAPSKAFTKLLLEISKLNVKKSCGFVICTKGLDHKNLKFFHQIFEEILPQKKYAILSGPNFAAEVASENLTVTTIASKNKIFAKKIVTILQNNYFKAEIFDDVVTAEICGVMKNIIAIGCGIVDGLGLGQNAKASVVCKGVAEILMLCKKLRAKPNLHSAAGFGDIFLTCSTTKSRNNSLGFAIARGENYQIDKTYEGVLAASSISKLAKKLRLKLDLCEVINEILQKKFSCQEISTKITKAIHKC